MSMSLVCSGTTRLCCATEPPEEEPPEEEPPPEDELPLEEEPPPEAAAPTVSVLPAATDLLPALTPETPFAAVTLVPEVETVTLSAFACTAPTLPEPVIFAPSATTVMLSTEPETAMSVLAIMPCRPWCP